MFGKRKPPPIPFPLHFKDGVGAVEYASKFMNCKLRPGVELPAVVLDAREFGVSEPVQVKSTGIQMAMLCVAGDRGPFPAMAQTVGAQGPLLEPGDFVSWRAFKYINEVGKRSPDRRTGWAGVIVGVLTPTLVAEGWVGTEQFRP